MYAIVLCGGMGTRLGSLTKSVPKLLLDVAGRPFLSYVLDQLCRSDIDGIILAVGYRANMIRQAIGLSWKGVPVWYSEESKPMGTGGAICLAMSSFSLDTALICNGDSLFKCDLKVFISKASQPNICTQLAVSYTANVERYGSIVLGPKGSVVEFREKGTKAGGLFNTGIYIQKAEALPHLATPFRRTRLLGSLATQNINQRSFLDGFIDIGIPKDLERARRELPLLS